MSPAKSNGFHFNNGRPALFDGRIYVAGHRGLVGSAILRRLQELGASTLITRTHAELELTNACAVDAFIAEQRPEYIFLAAAKVGGILANSEQPAEFIYDNLAVQTNVIHAAYRAGVKRLLFLGSSCIYPRDCPQPMKESYLLSGPLELTNRPYAVAKIAGIEMCWAYNRQYGTRFLAPMPTNLYGPNDNFDLKSSHVLPALMRKFHEAKEAGDSEVVVWGTGQARREFLHVDDMAAGCVHLMSLPENEFNGITSANAAPLINIGSGSDISIRELAELIADIVGYRGRIVFDASKPDGTPRKLLDVCRMQALGWKPRISLRDGIAATHKSYVALCRNRAMAGAHA